MGIPFKLKERVLFFSLWDELNIYHCLSFLSEADIYRSPFDSANFLLSPSALAIRESMIYFVFSVFTSWLSLRICHFIIHSYWSEPAEGSRRSLGDLYPGMPDPGSFWQLLDAASADPIPDVRRRHSALLWFSTKLGAGDQARWASHPWQVSAQRWSGQREQPAPILQHTWETLQQERGSCQGHPSSQLFRHVQPPDVRERKRLPARASAVEARVGLGARHNESDRKRKADGYWRLLASVRRFMTRDVFKHGRRVS